MFFWPVRVYYEDTDCGGVVYYANYLRFMERARTEWLRALGFEQDLLATEHGVIFAVRSVALDFVRPARFNDLLRVGAHVVERRAASLTFAQEVTTMKPGEEMERHSGMHEARANSFNVEAPIPVGIHADIDSEIVSESHARVDPDSVLCAGRVQVVCVDAVGMRPRRIPDVLLREISRVC
jgi:tol-pal system-associated acyl-CoA thioesterase